MSLATKVAKQQKELALVEPSPDRAAVTLMLHRHCSPGAGRGMVQSRSYGPR